MPAPRIEDLLAFLDAAPSPFHATEEAARRFEAAGFSRLAESDGWPIGAGRHLVVRGGSLVAWVGEPGAAAAGAGFRVVAAHTDSPNLRVKPRPDTGGWGCRQLGVEVYGGALWSSWLDRDLGLSGRVAALDGDRVQQRLFRDDRPLLRIPQLAIHLDRDVNTAGLRLDPQQHLTPIWGLGRPEEGAFAAYLATVTDLEPDAVVGWDVMAHDVTPAALAGLGGELVASARLDDLLSCWAAVVALTDPDVLGATDGSGAVPGTVRVVALHDHEEVGSVSASGADSGLLSSVLERIVLSGNGDRDAFHRAIAASSCVSADGAHATHPNHPVRHDPDHHIRLDGGPVIKHNVNQRYATDAPTAARFEAACRDAGVPVQHFVSRNDVPCGSTIGPITSARTGLATVDVGVAQLAMHSARETCGSEDPVRLARALTAYLRRS